MPTTIGLISTYLPQHEGLLPQWLLFVSIVSVLNSVQAYLTLSYTSRVYSSQPSSKDKSTPASAYPSTSPVTPLSARTFGTWTLVSSIVRLYAAYNIDNPQFYQLAFCTYAIAFAHFTSEWLIFKTARWGTPLAGPVFVSTGSMLWMGLQWSFYCH